MEDDEERVGRLLVSCKRNQVNGRHDIFRITGCLAPGLIECKHTRPLLHHDPGRIHRTFQRIETGSSSSSSSSYHEVRLVGSTWVPVGCPPDGNAICFVISPHFICDDDIEEGCKENADLYQ
jgi:hypothetical protein